MCFTKTQAGGELYTATTPSDSSAVQQRVAPCSTQSPALCGSQHRLSVLTLLCHSRDTHCSSAIRMSTNTNSCAQFEPLCLLFCLRRIRTKYYIKLLHSQSSDFNFCSAEEVEHTPSRPKHRFSGQTLFPSQVVSWLTSSTPVTWSEWHKFRKRCIFYNKPKNLESARYFVMESQDLGSVI